MPRKKIPAEVNALMQGYETVETITLYLPPPFMRALERWAERKGTTPEALVALTMADAINLADASEHVPWNVTPLRPGSR